MSLIKQIYKPAFTVGQVYARPYGVAAAPRTPVGNVLVLELSHSEDVKKQPDMTRLGGGTYAQARRINGVAVKLELADWNPVNFTRAIFGTAAVTAGAAVVDEPHTARLGGLLRLAGLQPSAVTVKKGVDVIDAENYEVRPEGIFIPDGVAGIVEADPLLVSYTHPEMVNMEALTSTAPELELTFGGLNEAESGKPVVVDIWRLASGITKTLALMQTDFGKLSIEGEVLKDPTKSGVGVSPYYRVQMV
jgi:hypothetical protein